MKCIYLKQKFNYKFECKRINKEIKLCDCSNCPYKEYKKCTKTVKKSGYAWNNAQKSQVYCANFNKHSRKLQSSAELKKKSNKLAKLEKERFSLFTDDLEHCIICGRKKDNIHEVFFGRNRLNSMKFGLTIPLCNYHHQMIHSNSALSNEYKKRGQALFDIAYPDLKFEDIFKKNYIK